MTNTIIPFNVGIVLSPGTLSTVCHQETAIMSAITILYLEHTMNPLTRAREPCFLHKAPRMLSWWRNECPQVFIRPNVL